MYKCIISCRIVLSCFLFVFYIFVCLGGKTNRSAVCVNLIKYLPTKLIKVSVVLILNKTVAKIIKIITKIKKIKTKKEKGGTYDYEKKVYSF